MRRPLIRHREQIIGEYAARARALGWTGHARYTHLAAGSVEGSSFALGRNITIRPHAFYEPGGAKSVFFHEVAHALRSGLTEFETDMAAVSLVQALWGTTEDIVLPFTNRLPWWSSNYPF